MSTKNSWKSAIKNYLDDRAKTDELFAKSYAKENKNFEQCCDYIMGEAKKRGNAVCMTSEEVFSLAVHYYDEDNIKVGKSPAGAKVATAAKPTNKPAAKLAEELEKRMEQMKLF